MTHIIIELEGGLVKSVWSTDKSICVEVLDRDLDEQNTDEEHQEYLEDIAAKEKDIKDKNMTDIYGD
jgi:hypothetical protein